MCSKIRMKSREVVCVSSWLVFGVFLSLVPLAFDALRWFLNENEILYSVQRAVLKGEAFIVCVALLGSMIGELLVKRSPVIIKIWVGGIAMAGLIFSAMSYIYLRSSDSLAVGRVSSVSLSVLCLTVVVGTIIVIVNVRGQS